MRLSIAALALLAAAPAFAQINPAPPTATYWIYVGAESADLMHRIRFGPDGASVEKTSGIGLVASEMEGPHGIALSADGKFAYVSTGHGNPEGYLWKYAVGADSLVGMPVMLGMFPASLDLTKDGLYAFIVNFNLHGEMVPSSVSVVYTPDMVEVARTTTCTMPHGSRLNAAGNAMYSTCMMDDQLVEIDTRSFAVKRRFSLALGKEGPLKVTPVVPAADPAQRVPMSAMSHEGHGVSATATCSPTWAQPSHDGARIFVACNKSDEIIEIDAKTWQLSRRFRTGRAPYNIAVTPDGRQMVVTLKAAQSVQIFDLTAKNAPVTIPTTTKIVHGVVISPDSRYAFVSVEGIGAEPGKVDIFDLTARQRVASVEVGQQASGIAFYRMEGH